MAEEGKRILNVFMNSEDFLEELSDSTTGDIFVVNNINLRDLTDRTKQELPAVAQTGRFGDLIPPTDEEIEDILGEGGTKLAEIIGLPADTNASAYTNHIPWGNVDDVPDGVFTTKVSQLENDLGFITKETDPIFTASPAYSITDQHITDLNSLHDTSFFSGDYNDLTNKPLKTLIVDSSNSDNFYRRIGLNESFVIENASTLNITTSDYTIENLIADFNLYYLRIQNNTGYFTVDNITSFMNNSGTTTHYIITLSSFYSTNYSDILDTYSDPTDLLTHLTTTQKQCMLIYDKQKNLILGRTFLTPVEKILTTDSTAFTNLVNRVTALETNNSEPEGE